MDCGPDNCPIVAFSDLTPAEQRVQRKRIVEKMSQQGFTEQQIAKQLGVSQATVSGDLRNLSTVDKLKPTKTASNPKGAGRPKGSNGTKAARQGNRAQKMPKMDEAREIVRPLIETGARFNCHTLAKEHGSISHYTFDAAVAAEKGRKEALEDKTALDPSHLSKSAQEKLDAAIRAHKRQLDLAWDREMRKRMDQHLRDVVYPHYTKIHDEHIAVLKARKGIMDKSTFRKIWSCLSPDSLPRVADKPLDKIDPGVVKLYENAFNLFSKMEKLLLDEAASPTVSTMPRGDAGWAKAREEVRARNSARSKAAHAMKRR